MKKSLSMITLMVAILAGCASAPLPEDQKAAWRGEGKIVSIVVNSEGHQEVGLVNEEGQHFSVVVKEHVDLFPEQVVRVNRKAGGFGTITP